MANFYINYRINEEQIIDEAELERAEKGHSFLNADDFMFLCEADSLEDAQDKYRTDCMLSHWEASHP
jgi:hypothetical protein